MWGSRGSREKIAQLPTLVLAHTGTPSTGILCHGVRCPVSGPTGGPGRCRVITQSLSRFAREEKQIAPGMIFKDSPFDSAINRTLTGVSPSTAPILGHTADARQFGKGTLDAPYSDSTDLEKSPTHRKSQARTSRMTCPLTSVRRMSRPPKRKVDLV